MRTFWYQMGKHKLEVMESYFYCEMEFLKFDKRFYCEYSEGNHIKRSISQFLNYLLNFTLPKMVV